MCGPTSVAQADCALERIAGHELGKPLVDPALSLPGFETALVKDGQPRAVVATVLKPAQSFEKDWSRLLPADVTDDAAHIGR